MISTKLPTAVIYYSVVQTRGIYSSGRSVESAFRKHSISESPEKIAQQDKAIADAAQKQKGSSSNYQSPSSSSAMGASMNIFSAFANQQDAQGKLLGYVFGGFFACIFAMSLGIVWQRNKRLEPLIPIFRPEPAVVPEKEVEKGRLMKTLSAIAKVPSYISDLYKKLFSSSSKSP